MTLPGKQMHLRLPDDLAKRFDQLCEELPGLPAGTILRGLLADQLRKPTDAQIGIVTEQLKKHPSDEQKASRKPKGIGLNSKNRIAGQ